MSSQGPGAALRRVETEAIGAGVKPKSQQRKKPSTADWVDRLIDQEIKAGRLRVTKAERNRLEQTMKGLGPDRLQRLVGSDASQPLVQRLEALAEAEGEKPTGRGSGDPIQRTLKAIGAASNSVQEQLLALPGESQLPGNSPGRALSKVEARARQAGVQESGAPAATAAARAPAQPTDYGVYQQAKSQSPNLSGLPGIKEHKFDTAPGETPVQITDEIARQKLLAGQDLTPFEQQVVEQSGGISGIGPNATEKQKAAAYFGATGIITGYEPVAGRPVDITGAERGTGREATSEREGAKHGVQGTPNAAGDVTTGKRPVIKSAGELEEALIEKTPAEIRTLQKQLQDAGFLPQGAKVSGLVDPDTIRAYDDLLHEVANYQSHYKDLTPDEYLAKKIAGINAGGGGKSSTSTETRTSVNLTDPITAKGYITGSMRTLLGRFPSSAEINNFIGSLNAAEQANPQVTTTTSTATQNAAGTNTNTNTSSTSSGGISSGADFGDSFIMQNNKQELNTNRAVDFYQLALQALRSPVSV